MSKKHITPQVGDVWIEKGTGTRISFINVNDYYCDFIQHNEKLTESYDIFTFTSDYKGWNKDFTYLGKSKANIDDLFKTENEE